MTKRKCLLLLCCLLAVCLSALALAACAKKSAKPDSGYNDGDYIVDSSEVEWEEEVDGTTVRRYKDNSYEIVYLSGNRSYITLEGSKLSEMAITGYQGDVLSFSLADLESISVSGEAVSVNEIKEDAFSGCVSLESVDLTKKNASLDFTVGNNAFFGCESLAQITLPTGGEKGVYANGNTIGDYAFAGTALTKFFMDDTYDSLGTGALQNCAALADVTLPETLTAINPSTFEGCISLTSFRFPSTVVSIGDRAFSGTRISSFDLSSMPKLESVGSYAFANNSSLTSLAVPDTVTHLGNGILSNDANFASLFIARYTYDAAEAGNPLAPTDICTGGIAALFGGDTQAEGFYSANGVAVPETFTKLTVRLMQSVPDSFAAGLSSLESVSLSLESGLLTGGMSAYIGDNAFRGCTLLGDELTIEGSYQSIGSYAFAETALRSFTLPQEVIYLGDHAFDGTLLTRFTLTEGLAYVGEGLFYNVEGLSSLDIAQNYYRAAADNLFYETFTCIEYLFGADPLSVWLADHPSSDEEDYPFYTAYNKAVPKAFTSLTVDSMLTVPAAFLRGMRSLTDISLSIDNDKADLADIVPEIGQYAFDGCTQLDDDFSLYGTYGSIGARAFAETSITRFTVPDSVTYVGEGAFYGTENFTSLTIEQNYWYDATALAFRQIVTSAESLFGADPITTWLSEHPSSDEEDYPFYTAYNKAVPEALSSLTVGGMLTVPASFLRGMRSLTSVSLSIDDSGAALADITPEIGRSAFDGCTRLGSGLSVYGKYESIGERAFAETALTRFTVPDSVTYIGDGAFYGTEDLSSLTIGQNSYFDSYSSSYYDVVGNAENLFGADPLSVWLSEHPSADEDDYPFYTAYNKAVPKALSSLTVGGMLTVPASFLRGMNSLTYLSLSIDSDRADLAGIVPQIGEYALAGCSQLGDEMTILGSYEAIGEHAFAGTALTQFTVPDSVTRIGQGAFYDVPTLASLTVESYSSYVNYSYQNSFSALGSLFGTSVTLGDWINENPFSAEEEYPYYTDADGNSLPKALTTLAVSGIAYLPSEFARDATSLTEVSLTFDLGDFTYYEDIGAYAFEGCSSLVELSLSGSYLYSIGNYAFANTALTDFTLPDSVTSVGDGIVGGNFLTSLTVASVSTSGSEAGLLLLFGTSAPESGEQDAFYPVTYDSSVYYIPATLTQLTLQDVDTIPSYYAYGLASLTEATLSMRSGASVGDYAFADCTGLLVFETTGNYAQIGSHTFENCAGLSEFVLPDTLERIGEYAFAGCSALSFDTLPESVTFVGEGAFEGCILPETGDGLTVLGNWLTGYSGNEVVVLPAGVTQMAENVMTESFAPQIVYTLGTEEEWRELRYDLPSSVQNLTPVYLTAENYVVADGVGYLLQEASDQPADPGAQPVLEAYVISVDGALSFAEIAQSVLSGDTACTVVGIRDRALRSEKLSVLVVADNVRLTQENCGSDLFLDGLRVYSTGPQENWMLGSALPTPYEYGFADIDVTYTFYDSDRETVLATQNAPIATDPHIEREGFILTAWLDADGYAVTFPYQSTSQEDRAFYAQWKKVITYSNLSYSSSSGSNGKRWTVSPSATGQLVTDLTLSAPGNNCNASFTVTALCAMEITFTYSASINESATYDYLKISHNNTQLVKSNRFSASTRTVTMAEGDTLTFLFHTDTSGTTTSDKATIADITYEKL